MLDRSLVRQDVARCVKRVILEKNNVFDEENFHFGLVPGEAPMNGWGAGKEAWGSWLKVISKRLRNNTGRPEYKPLRLGPRDAVNTLSKPLNVTNELLTERILKANEKTGDSQ